MKQLRHIAVIMLFQHLAVAGQLESAGQLRSTSCEQHRSKCTQQELGKHGKMGTPKDITDIPGSTSGSRLKNNSTLERVVRSKIQLHFMKQFLKAKQPFSLDLGHQDVSLPCRLAFSNHRDQYLNTSALMSNTRTKRNSTQ